MKLVIKILAILLLLHTGVSKGQEIGSFSNSSFNLQFDSYRLLTPKSKKGFLETTKMSIGTIYKSHHFNNENFNESHNGIYLSVANWAVGTYTNSGYKDSVFVTYNTQLYQHKSLKLNLVTGVADGYEGWKYAQGDYLPVLGISAQWMHLKTILSPDFLAFGVELPLN